MSLLRQVKRLVPTAVKTPIREWMRSRRFHTAFARYRQSSPTPEASDAAINELVAAWDNEGFSALTEYLTAIVNHARQCKGPILECGSGLSTLLLGVEAERLGVKVWTLEHHDEWAKRMRQELRQANITSVEVCHAPIRIYGDFAWYDPLQERMPNNFSLVVCDGPPGETLGGRYGLMPILKDRMHPGCVILLDDFDRTEEQAVARRWASDTSATISQHGMQKPYALLRLP